MSLRRRPSGGLRPGVARLGGLALALGSLEFAVSYGGDLHQWLGVGLALAVGVAVYRYDETTATESAFGDALVGLLGGGALSLAVATGLLAGLLGVPLDLALWQSTLALVPGWGGVATALLSAYFLSGLVASLAR